MPFIDAYVGELSALGTAMLFAVGSTLFTLSGREIGSALVNRTRLLIAVCFIMGLHWITYGQLLPLDATTHPVFWLGLSGFVGLALGDAALFQAFVMIGPRIAMLIMALAPVLSTLLAWLFLGESLSLQDLAGIGLAVGGIAVVVGEPQGKPKTDQPDTRREYLIGLLLAFGGSLGQALGNILSKVGLQNDFPALSGNLIRLSVALIAIWGFTALRGQIVPGFRKLRQHPRALLLVSIAAITGPGFGVWLSLIAVQKAPVGIASTLMSLTPIFLLPIGYFVFHERLSRLAIIGTLVAVAGTVLIFL